MSDNKLGLGIIAFEGTELIAQIVMEIKDLVDYVVIGFQKKSYTGDDCDPNDLAEVEKLKAEGIVDEVLYIETNHTDFPRVQETEKRNKLLDNIIEHGCTHELIIDSDEFYSHDSFMRAKQKVYQENLEMTYCRYVNYFHDYTHYLIYPFQEGQYVPFIAKTKYRFAWQCKDFPLPSDPTRRFVRPKRYSIDPKTHQPIIDTFKTKDGKTRQEFRMEYTVGYYTFEWKELKMHHLSWLRADIRKKMNAWSSKSYFDNYLEIIDKSAERFNNFTEETKNDGAFLLFNTPGNKVDIGTFNKQYIFPKEDFDYHKRTNNEPHHYRIKSETFTDDITFDDFLNKIDSLVKLEQFKGHKDNEMKTREISDYDYVLFTKNGVETDLEDFIDRLSDDSVIYTNKDESLLILSFSTILKIRRYAKLEWNIDHTMFEGIRETMKDYCQKNNLTEKLYWELLDYDECL